MDKVLKRVIGFVRGKFIIMLIADVFFALMVFAFIIMFLNEQSFVSVFGLVLMLALTVASIIATKRYSTALKKLKGNDFIYRKGEVHKIAISGAVTSRIYVYTDGVDNYFYMLSDSYGHAKKKIYEGCLVHTFNIGGKSGYASIICKGE